jgi:CHAD domain-containing protein
VNGSASQLRESFREKGIWWMSIRDLSPDELAQLEAFAKSLGHVCGEVARDLSDFRKALQVAAISSGGESDLGPGEPKPHMTAGQYGYASLRRTFSEFLQHQAGTKLGEDAEQLHQMRVAARRFRATIKLFKPAIAPEMMRLADEVKWIAGILGVGRDLDVQKEWLLTVIKESAEDDAAAMQPLLSQLDQRASESHFDVAGALNSERFHALTTAMTSALRRGFDGSEESELPVQVFAEQGLRQRHRGFVEQAKRLHEDSPDTELHALRVRAKRLRYALECFRPLLGPGIKPMIKETTVLQDLLGEHQDCAVFAEQARTLFMSGTSTLPPTALIRLGELVEQRRQRMVEIRAAWRKQYKRVKKEWRPAKKSMKASRRDVALAHLQTDHA